jgi:hypothetical protein
MDESPHPAMTERAATRSAPLSRADFAFAERIDGREAEVEPGAALDAAIEDCFDGRESAVVALDSGTYQVDAPIVLEGAAAVGLVAKSGAEVVLEAPADYEKALLAIRDVERALVAGIDVGQRAPGAHPKLGVTASERFLIEDVAVRGIGDSTDTGSRMPLRIEREGGVGVCRRVRAANGSASLTDPDDHETGRTTRPATWIGPESCGTIWFEDCHIEEHNSHAIYAAAAPGPIKILRGVYRNNDNSGIRFCGPDCEIDGALIELDTGKCAHAPHEAYRNTRGIFNEQKKHPRTGGLVRDTTIRVRKHPRPVGGYVACGSSGGMTIAGCAFEIDEDCPAITANAPGEHWGHPPAPEPRTIAVLDSKIGGKAREGTAVRIAGRPGSRVENCCIAGCGERRGVEIGLGSVRETTFDLDATAVVDAVAVGATRKGSCIDFFEERSPSNTDRYDEHDDYGYGNGRRGRWRSKPEDERDETGGGSQGLRGTVASLLERFDRD